MPTPRGAALVSCGGTYPLLLDSQLAHPGLKGRALQPETRSSAAAAANHAAAGSQHFDDVYALRFRQRTARGRLGDLSHGPQFRQGRAKGRTVREDHGALDDVLQLPNIAWPGVRRQRLHHFVRNYIDVPVHPRGEFSYKIPDQIRNVPGTLAQRRKGDWKNVEPVEQIGPEPALAHHLHQINVGRRNHANVDANRVSAAKPFELLLLEDAQQFGLQFQRQISDLVKEYRSPIGKLKAAR